MGTFKEWYDDADMPEKDADGKWFDLETGLPYQPDSGTKKRRAPDSKALAGRALAKQANGCALTGSAAQKNWGEKIRAEKITAMTPAEAELVCNPKNLCRTAKFWIENREKTSKAIVEFVVEQQVLSTRYKALRELGDSDELKAVANAYNNLTALWGFK